MKQEKANLKNKSISLTMFNYENLNGELFYCHYPNFVDLSDIDCFNIIVWYVVHS